MLRRQKSQLCAAGYLGALHIPQSRHRCQISGALKTTQRRKYDLVYNSSSAGFCVQMNGLFSSV